MLSMSQDLLDTLPDTAVTAAFKIARRTRCRTHDVGVILGSGWGAVTSNAEGAISLGTASLPGFRPPAVAGHEGRVHSMMFGDRRVLAFSGRTHLYEGHGTDAVVHAVRVMAASGCRAVVLTNGCGSTRPEWLPGTVVVLKDHINLTGCSPLSGAQFVDMTDAYSAAMRGILRTAVPGLKAGVYAQFRGPQYETPAEVRMAATLGADLVGMSTALETIEARRLGLEVLGLSLVTNLAAGVGDGTLDHSEVLEAGQQAGDRLKDILSRTLQAI